MPAMGLLQIQKLKLHLQHALSAGTPILARRSLAHLHDSFNSGVFTATGAA